MHSTPELNTKLWQFGELDCHGKVLDNAVEQFFLGYYFIWWLYFVKFNCLFSRYFKKEWTEQVLDSRLEYTSEAIWWTQVVQ